MSVNVMIHTASAVHIPVLLVSQDEENCLLLPRKTGTKNSPTTQANALKYTRRTINLDKTAHFCIMGNKCHLGAYGQHSVA